MTSPSRPRIGVPRSLLYHRYAALWPAFLEGIGCEPVVSGRTDLAMVARGSELAPDEVCLPLKIHLGHVASLAGRVDAVLVPRIVSLDARQENCSRFMATYDVVANVLPEVELLTFTVDVKRGERERQAMTSLGRRLGASRAGALAAWWRASRAQRAQDAAETRAQQALLHRDAAGPRVLLLAHSYNLADALVGEPVAAMLERLGATVVSAEALGHGQERRAAEITRDLYWTYNRELVGAVARWGRHVDGVLCVVTFPCGPDSLMVELLQRRLRDIPVAALVLDDLSGTGGLATRLESFVDILRARRSTPVGSTPPRQAS